MVRMRIDVITLFPQLIAPYLEHGVNRRAAQAGVAVHFWNPRDFAAGAYRRIDDRPFGGGPGMVMQAEPLAACVEAIRAERGEVQGPKDSQEQGEAEPTRAPVVYFSPLGRPIVHAVVSELAQSSGMILLCGRYEGVDQRFIDAYVDCQLSLGDFVLSGGEVAAAALLDAVLRLQPEVLHDAQSHMQDSFNPSLSGLLDCPHYTRPDVWREQGVPAVLLSGDHARIEAWRRQQSLQLSHDLRPDLLAKARQQGLISKADEKLLASKAK